MPGRQSHGRPLLGSGSNPSNKPGKSHARTFKKSRAKATAKALDAFALAAEQVSESTRGVRTRGLNADDDDDDDTPHPSQKRQRGGEDDDDEDEDDFDEEPRKKPRRDDGEFNGFDDDEEEEGDEEEWHVGVNAEDEDSELDSDEAFGESDEEKFDGYAFSGSTKKGKRKGGVEEEEDDDDLESLGSDAIDLATALDQFEEDEDEDEEGRGGEGSDDEEEEESTDADDESEEDDEEEDPSKLDALQSIIAGFGGGDDEDEEMQIGTGKAKLSLKDLGLAGVKDPHMKRSLRLMNKEEKAVKPGSSKKLEVPLAKRQQDRLLRSAAYEKTNETLDRWIETVKHNRRADHLVFPLAQNAHDRGLNSGELMPITQKTSGTELENTILAIMEESGLGPSAKPEEKEAGEASGQTGLSQAEQKEIARQRRREREMHSREMARAKRIKKIKSKAYRRIHRKELAREEQAEHDEALANGELDSDDEREALDRRRALERVGTRHRESKWAKLGKKTGRAVWDDDFRAGLTDAARRKEELRRRIEGKAHGSDDDDDGSDVSDGSGEGDPRQLLLEQLENAAGYSDDDEPKSKLMQMKFMQRGEELRKKENEDLIAQIRRDLKSDDEGDSDEEQMEVGRKQFGMGNAAGAIKPTPVSAKKAAKAAERALAISTASAPQESTLQSQDQEMDGKPSAPAAPGVWVNSSAPAAPGPWSQGEQNARKSKKASKPNADVVDITAAALVIKPSKPQSRPKNTVAVPEGGADDSDSDADVHLPMAIRDQHLIERAFAGEDVHGQFEEEKAEAVQEDEEKEVDNTLPGWGGWVGEGVSAREKRRHQGRFITKVEGVKKMDRKDYKLKDVIVNEKRIRKNDKYLASQLPHPFESQQQYERSLRLPVGPEWSTKETFQDATKPRVIIKQGVIAPMSKPMY
ncbi:hypothetical protein N0V88_005252 [Collariella sp. IMI 366227]|nr:hypothetical protein N0V88_005252 [Collariella sp. IMI 366227]